MHGRAGPRATLARLLRPRVVIPALTLAGGIGALFLIGSPSKIIRIMERFNPWDLLWVFLLTVIYEFARLMQWSYLLDREGVRVSLKAKLFSFGGREATRFLPIGDFFQNYLLQVAEGVDFGFTSAATTVAVAFEAIVCLTGLMILGLGPLWWLRWVVLGGCVVGLVALVVFRRLFPHTEIRPPGWVLRREWARAAWAVADRELRRFARGARTILMPATMAATFGLTAASVVAAGVTLFVVLAGLGWTRTPWDTVLAVYFFNLAVILIVPLPTDVGVFELAGLGALLLVGVEENVAIGALLLNRVLTLGFGIALAGLTWLCVWDEVRKALRAHGSGGRGRPRERHDGGREPGASPEGPSAGAQPG